MNVQQTAPIKPDEKAQIVVNTVNAPGIILRFRTVKKAEAAYQQLQKAWNKMHDNSGKYDPIVSIKSDMFVSTIDLSSVANLSLVIHDVRMKFEPVRE